MTDTQVLGKSGMKKTLSIWNYFTIGFGAIIGSGWILLVGDWMIIGGGPIAAMIAFFIGAILLLPIGAVFGELTAAIPISGGIVEYVDRTFGCNASYLTGWFLALGNGILCPWEAIAISTLISEMFGEFFPVLKAVKLYSVLGADVYLFPTLITLGLAIYVIILNSKGASTAAKLQGFLIKVLFTGMILAMAISVIKGSPLHIFPAFLPVVGTGPATSATNLWEGIISVLVMAPFFYAGFDTIPQQAEESAEGLDWNRFGKVIGLVLLASAGFYMVCIYSFGTLVSWTEFIKGNVPALASLKNISMPLYVVMLCIATLSPMGPMNSFYSATARILLAMGRKGQLPFSFARVSTQSGTPVAGNILLAVLTIIGPFLGRNMLIPLTNVSALAFIFACTMVSFSCLRMRRTEPNLPRPYKVPGGQLGIGVACVAGSILVGLMIIPGSPAALKPVEWGIMLGWLTLGFCLKLYLRRGNRCKANV